MASSTYGIEFMSKPRTPYAIYVQFRRSKYEADHNGQAPPVFLDFMLQVSLSWNNMTNEEKKPFLAQAVEEGYETDECIAAKQNAQSGSALKEPLRPFSAFYIYCRRNREIIQRENPEMTPPQIALKLGEMWKNSSRVAKAEYEELAEKDKVRYDEQLEAYNSTLAKKRQAAINLLL